MAARDALRFDHGKDLLGEAARQAATEGTRDAQAAASAQCDRLSLRQIVGGNRPRIRSGLVVSPQPLLGSSGHPAPVANNAGLRAAAGTHGRGLADSSGAGSIQINVAMRPVVPSRR